MNKFPRPIKPELIEIGDDIEIIFNLEDGLTLTRRGVVTGREDHGTMRYLIVGKSTILLAWEPGVSTKSKYIVHSRKPVDQMSLFEPEFITEVRKRIA